MARPGRSSSKAPLAMPLLAAGALSVVAFLAATPTAVTPGSDADHPRLAFAKSDTDWVAEFQAFAALARGQELASDGATIHAGDIGDVAEATDPVAAAPVITPLIASAAPLAGSATARLDGPVDPIVTGSLKPSHRPLLPPVPGPDAFKVGKGDRLPPIPAMPSKPEARRDNAGTPSPHADLSLDAPGHRRPGPRTYSTRADEVEPAPVAPAPGTAPTLAYSGPGQSDTIEQPFQALFAAPDASAAPGPAVAALDTVTKPVPMRPSAYADLPKSVKDDRQQQCLVDAIYFGAADQGTKAQQAVAQVMLNRVLSRVYPNTICGVVYQRTDRRHCQFDFMCSHHLGVERDEATWRRAVVVAREATAGRVYLDDIADSTHFRSGSDKPDWASQMQRVAKIGGLTFYRAVKS
ncbi:MAG: cell wall hydrolase [Ancalomicrobiaceae bacterium]|nr:cell wall hydrolase [Ancalomicrobiaceae bacterium]